MRAALALLPAAAREAVRAALEGRAPVPPAGTAPELARAAPVFVTLRIGGALRGCMGTLAPRRVDLVAETMERACAAAFEDPRFPPLTAAEFEACRFEVTVLEPPEPAGSTADLDPAVFGIEVAEPEGERRAVLLPGIPGIDTVERQLAAARTKAGLAPDAAVRLRRFRVLKVAE